MNEANQKPVKFKMGPSSNMPDEIAGGTIYVLTDKHAMCVDVDDKTRIQVGEPADYEVPTDEEIVALFDQALPERDVLIRYNRITEEEIDDLFDDDSDYGQGESEQLPDSYVEVDYLESDGNQYINTEINASSDIQIEGRVGFSHLKENLDRCESADMLCGAIIPDLLGATFGMTDGVYRCSLDGNDVMGSVAERSIFADAASGGVDKTRLIDSANFSFGDEAQTIYNAHGDRRHKDGDWDLGIPIYLFGTNVNNQSVIYDDPMRIYHIKVIDAMLGVDIAHFIPAMRRRDRKLGLYDTVRNRFFTNAGTGDFTTQI